MLIDLDALFDALTERWTAELPDLQKTLRAVEQQSLEHADWVVLEMLTQELILQARAQHDDSLHSVHNPSLS